VDCATRRYQPRHAEASVLRTIIREHLDDFLRAAADRGDGTGLPEFIAREFGEFLTCGVLAHGFARVRCALERLVPFFCYPQQETMKSSGLQTGCLWDPARESLQIVSGQQARQ
jgi:hypothetical protein